MTTASGYVDLYKPDATRRVPLSNADFVMSPLMGLKENVIVGRLIPAGTGSVMNRLRAIAAGRDQRALRTPPVAPAIPGRGDIAAE